MEVNRQRFLDEGYLIIRRLIAQERLDKLRVSYEALVDRQKEIWARTRTPGDPPGGVWETAKQPRVSPVVPGVLDTATADAVEVWLQENTLGVSEQLLCLPDAGASLVTMMCNPTWDYGPDEWHRDVHPIDMAPMRYLSRDVWENGPRYVQWNIPLYDDDVLWVVPGSHRRLNSGEEDRVLLEEPRTPLPGGIPVELKAGDAVVYINYLLHWGSDYSPKLRRTLHGGHSIYPSYPDLGFTEYLSPPAREKFLSWDRRSAELKDRTEATLRAAMAADQARFRQGVESLQPGAGDNGKAVLAIYLCKAAQHIHALKGPPADLDTLPEEDQRIHRRASGQHPITLNWGPGFADRFSLQEADLLWERFRPLDAMLKSDDEQFSPGFQSKKMHYYFNSTPVEITLDGVISTLVA